MAATIDAATTGARTFDSISPATGERVGTFPVHGQEDVDAAVRRARDVGRCGGAASRTRSAGSACWRVKGAIARGGDDLIDLIHRENGKPSDDAAIELVLVVDHLDWAARHAERVMRPRKVRSTPVTMDQQGSIEYQPAGVVGVIGPWNYPAFTPMGSISYALAGGNAVVFKPSEFTPAVGAWLVETITAALGGEPVAQLLTGFGDTGAALCSHPGIDVLAFTGSATTGRARDGRVRRRTSPRSSWSAAARTR